jgi:glycosyltransferase involved in cell wall biosynthesis
MRVLIASLSHFCDLPGGAQRIVDEEASALRDRGHDVWVLATGTLSQPEHEARDGIHLLRYVPEKVAAWNPARRSGHQRASTAVLRQYLPRVDAIHGHSPLPYLAALNLYGGSVHACYEIHSPARMEMAIVWRNSGLLRRAFAPLGLALISRMEEECLRRSTIVAAKSQYTIDCIAGIHGSKLARSIRLLPGWVDTSRYVPVQDRKRGKEQMGWPTDVPILFTLRRLTQRMGLDRLIDATQRLRSEGLDFRLMIAGSGPMRGKLEEQARALKVDDIVGFMGRLEDEQLPLAYGSCDAFVLPTAELECFGLIALEALSAGRPVLATPAGAIPEILRKFEPSWLSRSPAVDDIAELLRRFLAGRLPEHDPAYLHKLTHQQYSRELLAPSHIDAWYGSSAHV